MDVMMISAAMVVLSILALSQFMLAYCQALLSAYCEMRISERTRQVAKITGDTVNPGEFDYLMGLVRAAWDPGDDGIRIRAVKFYYSVLHVAEQLLAPFSPRVSQWTERELGRCAYFAAVSLDRRLLAVPVPQE